jgi:hypothetical protein
VIPLDAPIPQAIDEEIQAVRDDVSEGYSASEPFDDREGQKAVQGDAQTWEDAGRENPMNPAPVPASPTNIEFDQGGGVSVTLLDNMASDDEDADILSRFTKHPASTSLPSEPGKMENMDDDPTPVPKIKAAGANTNVNQVTEIERLCHNDGDMFPAGWEDDAVNRESEDECIAEQGEGEGPSNVSAVKLQQLDERAAFDEVEKLFHMDVIQPVVLTDSEAATENVVETTLVYDWRYKNDQWVRRCRIVAKEFKTNSTDESNFPPTSSFASVRMLLVFALRYGLAITALDVKDALLTVPQVETIYGRIANWIRKWAGNRSTHWLLKRCLPGQRNAALRWHQHIGQLCEQSKIEAFPGAPTVFRRKDVNRKLYANIHVDDIFSGVQTRGCAVVSDSGGSNVDYEG